MYNYFGKYGSFITSVTMVRGFRRMVRYGTRNPALLEPCNFPLKKKFPKTANFLNLHWIEWGFKIDKHWIEWGTKNFAPPQPFWGALSIAWSGIPQYRPAPDEKIPVLPIPFSPDHPFPWANTIYYPSICSPSYDSSPRRSSLIAVQSDSLRQYRCSAFIA